MTKFLCQRDLIPIFRRIFFRICASGFCLLHMVQCQEASPPKPQVIVRQPERINQTTEEIIRSALAYAIESNGRIDDTIRLMEPTLVNAIYRLQTGRLWSHEKSWLPRGDELNRFIQESERYGLFPEDYQERFIRSIRNKLLDTLSRNDAALWARGDLICTDAFVRAARHIKLGRIGFDSVSLRNDTLFSEEQVLDLVSRVRDGASPISVLESLEPGHEGYRELKNALPAFLDSMDRLRYTYIEFPRKDSVSFARQLQARLFESAMIGFNQRPADSMELALAIRRFQEAKRIKVDGKAGPQVIHLLNNTSRVKFARIAINMDRYKQLPENMPARYVWVNLPAFQMQVFDSGLVLLESRVIVGQAKTRTPVLTSEISNLVTFPQWTVPFSIIIKEMLPKIQRDVSFLDKQNLMVFDRNDSLIDPYTVDWSRLSKTYFPYNLKQREGDDNSLGIIKFNFRNKYSVYLHDTNARSLFSRQNRAMSHGCVRVQEWKQLASLLVENDTARAVPDSLAAWLDRREKHIVPLGTRVPVWFRYMTAYVKEGTIRFYDDIYGEDKLLIMRHLKNKL